MEYKPSGGLGPDPKSPGKLDGVLYIYTRKLKFGGDEVIHEGFVVYIFRYSKGWPGIKKILYKTSICLNILSVDISNLLYEADRFSFSFSFSFSLLKSCNFCEV